MKNFDELVSDSGEALAGTLARCRGCETEVVWARTADGELALLNADGGSHFVTCPSSARYWVGAEPVITARREIAVAAELGVMANRTDRLSQRDLVKQGMLTRSLLARYEAAVAMLRELEWNGPTAGGARSCGLCWHTDRHADDCRLRKLLGDLDAPMYVVEVS